MADGANRHISVEGPIFELALKASFSGFRPPTPSFTRVIGGTVSGQSFGASASATFRVNEGNLVVGMAEPAGNLVDFLSLAVRGSSNEPGVLIVDEGLEIRARIAAIESSGTLATVGEPHKRGWTVVLRDWKAQRRSPVAWVGVMNGDFVSRARGNLALRDSREAGVDSSNCNLRLQGNYGWTIVGQREEAVAIIDTAGRELELRLVATDLAALELSFGRALRLEWIAGVDGDGAPVAWAGSGALTISSSRRDESFSLAPIPVEWTANACWTCAFFARAARALSGDGETPWIAFNAIMDAVLDPHLDAVYLKLQVALESLCSEVPRAKSPLLVKDSAAWSAWVDAHRSEIAAYASTSEAADKLVNKVIAAQQPPSTDTVEEALVTLGLAPTSEIMDEVGQRNRSVHRFLMNRPDSRRDLQRDWDRVRMLRELLVAVFAKRIGYAGPISGWQQDALGHLRVSSWWPFRDEEDASRVYMYSRLPRAGDRTR